MIDNYNEAHTRQQAEAVARLSYACGISVDMNYGLSGSGAEGEDQAAALMKYFGFGKCTTLLERKDFSIKDWQNLMYASVSAGAPVAYMGHSSSGGHAFLLDGYQGDGYFHFNWGWTGDADGYFLLTSLNPYEDSLPGYTYGYNMEQKAVVFALPATVRDTPLIVMSNVGSLSGTCAADKSTISIKGDFKYLGNETAMIKTGVKIEGDIYEAELVEMTSQSSIHEISVALPLMRDGTYSLTPVYHDGTEWKDISAPINSPDKIQMNVDGDCVTFVENEPLALELTRLVFNTPFYMGCPFEISFDIHNANSFEQGLQYYIAILSDDGNVIWNWNPEAVFMDGNETKTVVSQNVLPFFSDDKAKLAIAYYRNDILEYLGSPVDILLERAPQGHDFEGTGIYVTNAYDNPYKINVNYGIRSVKGFYCYKPRFAIIDGDGNVVMRKELGHYDFVLDGESGSFTRSITIPELSGGTYTFRLYASVSGFDEETSDDAYMPFLGEAVFTLNQSGIEPAWQDDALIYVEGGAFHGPAGCRIYDLRGVELSPFGIQPGIYIVKYKNRVSKFVVR